MINIQGLITMGKEKKNKNIIMSHDEYRKMKMYYTNKKIFKVEKVKKLEIKNR